jgi:hypothetical protein
MTKLTTAIAVCGSVALLQAQAGTLFDAQGFEGPSYALGNLSGQNGWTYQGSPTAGVVQNTTASSGTQAVQLSGATTTWAWPNLGYTPAASEIVRVSFDVRWGAFAAVNNFGYFVDVYNAEAGDRVARAGLVRTGTSTAPGSVQGGITIGGAAPGTYLVGSPLANNTWYNFVMDLDFAADTFSVSINGTSVAANAPFVASAIGIGDADIQISAVAASGDVGFIDNYLVKTVVVPEPSSFALLALGGMAGIWFRRAKTA